MGKARIRTVRLALAALALVSLAACGDDEDGGGSVFAGEGISNPDAIGEGGGVAGDGPSGGNIGDDGTLQPIEGACPDGQARTSRVVPRVILVLDGSCSMSTEYGAEGPSATRCTQSGSSRWGSLRNALLNPQTGVVSTLAPSIEFGLVIFGTQPMCPIPATPIQPAINNGGAIDNAFPNTPPGMFTPTGPALQWVYENMIGGPNLDYDQGDQIVLLATDGEPNSCDNADPNYQPVVDAVTFGRQMGVTTYVISLANASGEFHDHLQQVANLGARNGTGTLYQPTTPEQLAADLQTLIGGAVGCDVALNGELTQERACTGTVTLNGRELACGTDWVLADPRHIRLTDQVCQEFQRSANAQLRADFPCGSFRPD